MTASTDKIIHRLLSSLEPASSLFYVGQYCGDWQASTNGRARASFHVVLHGTCWLHFNDGRPSISVSGGDAVFLLRDIPHWLSANPNQPGIGMEVERRGTMQPLDNTVPDSVGLACGFVDFHGNTSQWIVSMFPEHLIVRQGDAAHSGVHAPFDLLHDEASASGDRPSPLLDRLGCSQSDRVENTIFVSLAAIPHTFCPSRLCRNWRSGMGHLPTPHNG
ncbi:cupin domain-containing protein [Burkholderia ambifaria]|uniref:cupin domain-containing protein n=1 Tax=Burkholderia ambifaria TaxID=152480 RepID=UPI001B92B5F1|nr:cupin domain-containing protein [Burkholderia ambifaria]